MEVNYQSLLEWRIKEGLPDQWFVSIQGTTSQEIFSLDQIRQMHTNSPSTSISVLNINHQNIGNQWYLYKEVSARNDEVSVRNDEENYKNKEIIGCAWVAAFIIPILGLVMALFFLVSKDYKNKAPDLIVISIFMFILHSGITYFLFF